MKAQVHHGEIPSAPPGTEAEIIISAHIVDPHEAASNRRLSSQGDVGEDAHLFPVETYDTSLCFFCPVRSTLIMKEELVEFKTQGNICHQAIDVKTQVPYAQLGMVDETMALACCCFPCWQIKTDQGVIQPDLCFNKEKVQYLSRELQRRKVAKGNIKLLEMKENLVRDLDYISRMFDAYTEAASIDGTPESLPITTIPVFEYQEYDITNYPSYGCCGFCCAGVKSGCCYDELRLEKDELVKTSHNPCYHSVERRPYAQLGNVTRFNLSNGCELFGKIGVAIDNWNAIPEWGSSLALVKEIESALKDRQLYRGNVAQLKYSKAAAAVVANVHGKLSHALRSVGAVEPAPLDSSLAS